MTANERWEAVDYLHDCLALHPEVTTHRYGKTQRLDEVERNVQRVVANGCEMWDIIRGIYYDPAFDADMFGTLPEDKVEATLKERDWNKRWQDWQQFSQRQCIDRLFDVFRQIEPVSVVLHFIDPKHYGIISSPVATILGVRPRRKAQATYQHYLENLQDLARNRHFKRAADVEMALWVLQVGVLDKLLSMEQHDALEKRYDEDVELKQRQTNNLTVHLFAEKSKLDLAEALLSTDVAIAAQIAGIEFERLVGRRANIAPGSAQETSLSQLINGVENRQVRNAWHRARKIRNRAIHAPQSVTRDSVEYLIDTARNV